MLFIVIVEGHKTEIMSPVKIAILNTKFYPIRNSQYVI